MLILIIVYYYQKVISYVCSVTCNDILLNKVFQINGIYLMNRDDDEGKGGILRTYRRFQPQGTHKGILQPRPLKGNNTGPTSCLHFPIN
jgi:hypothetical protein